MVLEVWGSLKKLEKWWLEMGKLGEWEVEVGETPEVRPEREWTRWCWKFGEA